MSPPGPRAPWVGVELRHFAVLAAVADTGSFRGAGARLGYAQSAVSQHVAFLERQAGRVLVERSRGPRPVALTDAGQALVLHAYRMLGRLQAADTDLALLASDARDVVRVGIEPSIARRVLPAVLAELRDERPEDGVVPVEIADQADALDLVETGRLDMAFVDLPVPDGPLDAMELVVDPFVLLVPADAALASLDREPDLADIAELRLLGRSADRVAGQVTQRAKEPPTDLTVQALVAAGHGAAVIPRLAIDDYRGTVALGVGELIAPRILGLCWHGDRRVGDAIAALQRAAKRAFATQA